MKNKIGIGIITVDREDFFKKCINSLPHADYVVVVHNGAPYTTPIPDNVEVISLLEKQTVAKNKNIALKKMMDAECDHLFLCEDDIHFTKQDLCEDYIKTAADTGIWHLNYGAHGFYNKNPLTGLLNVKKIIEYKNTKLDLYHNILGAWSYYYKNVIKHVGYMDEDYHNAMEHVDHTYKIIKAGLHPPFWWFADMHESYKHIHDVEEDHGGSAIRDDNFEQTLRNGVLHFKNIHGTTPFDIHQQQLQEVSLNLRKIHSNYNKSL